MLYRVFGIVVFVILLANCATVEPYDYTKLQQSKPRSILVIPPMNNSVEVSAPYSYISSISKPLAEKGYYVFPVAVIDKFLKENGLPTPAEMNSVPIDKLRENIGADAIFYVEIDKWGQTYQVIQSKTEVDSRAKLVDSRTGETLWDARMHFVQASDDAGAGLLGALVNAVATQIAGSIKDRTPQVSSTANKTAINSTKRGLLPGPYYQPKK